MGTLFLVATPIGNLADLSPRAIDTLKQVNLILAEDTRHTGLLLKQFSITTPMKSFYDQVELQRLPEIISRLKAGENIALVSDAGTPLIADPGYKLVREAINQQIPLDIIPGPSALTAALLLSGLPPDKFVFLGYPPKKGAKRKSWFEKLQQLTKIGRFTLIWYESPHRVKDSLEDLAKILGADHQLVLAREMTKIHQEVLRDNLAGMKERITQKPLKGEIVLLTHV